MMVVDELLRQTGEWLRGSGPEAEIVISGRVRLARNLQGYRFISRMDPDEREACEDRIHKAILKAGVITTERYVPLHQSEPLDRRLLVERHLISREHEDAKHPRGVAIGEREALSIMVNEEDHVRLQVFQSGFQVGAAWQIASRTDDRLAEHLDFAFSPQLGFLTACPTNVGTGLRVSVMLHLPALVLTRHLERVFQAVSKINLGVRGLYGEGTEASGHFYQISNQVSLGKTEEEIVANVEQVIPTIVTYERKAREELLKRDRVRLEDRVWRAYGMLRSARTISSEESMMLLSALRMGVHLGLIRNVNLQTVNELFLCTQPAHLQKLAQTEMEPDQRDVHRAEIIRQRLNGKPTVGG
jgi:protein arginine kinase